MAEPLRLEPLSETKLDVRPHRALLTLNPSIELFAWAAGPTSLQIWRTNGQTVVKSHQRGDRDTVEALRWKADGQFLAVGWSDGVVRLMGLENSKPVHQIPVCEAGQAKITCIGWARNHVGNWPASSTQSTPAWDSLGLENLSLGDRKTATPDLPQELTFLEIETALPKISPLPASGGSGDDMYVFTTRASLEFLFRPFSPQSSDQVDVMLVGTNDGHIHLSIYDSFVIGSFGYQLPGGTDSLKLAYHTSHPDLSTHTLVFQRADTENGTAMYVVPMDLTFIHSFPENLSLLASKTTTLQKLLRYVKQVQTHMMYEYQSTRELPGKFLNSINETLREAGTYGEMDISQAMYHEVVTGHTFPEVREWLVEQLAERGHKRWDKAVVTGLENLRGLVHENFLPALERIAIILSRLLGIARFHDSKEEIGFTGAQVAKVMDIVSCLIYVGHKILLLVMEELELFHAFSIWLRHEIDRSASSASSDELLGKEAALEHGKILAYIRQYMQVSPLRAYLTAVSREDAEKDANLAENGTSLLEMLDEQVKKQEAGKQSTATVPQVEFLCIYLSRKADVVLEGIAGAGKRSVRFGSPTKIELESSISRLDLRMCASKKENAVCGITYLAVTQNQKQNDVHIFRTEIPIVNGISGHVMTQHSCLTLGDATVVDVKFLNEESLLVLLSNQGRYRIIQIPHQSIDLGYQDYSPGSLTQPHILSTEQVTSVFPNMIVPADKTFLPMHMEVREAREERGTVNARVCLLGKDFQTCRVFVLPEKFLP